MPTTLRSLSPQSEREFAEAINLRLCSIFQENYATSSTMITHFALYAVCR